MRCALPILLLILCVNTMYAQTNMEIVNKFSPELKKQLITFRKDKSQHFWLSTNDAPALKELISEHRWPIELVSERGGGLVVVKASWKMIDSLQRSTPLIQFIDLPRQPHEELALAVFENSLNGLNRVHKALPTVDGNNVVVSVKENKPDSADIDFLGRWLTTTVSAPSLSQHATTMATIIGGGGNSFYTARGAAPGITVSSSDFASLLPDADNIYQQYGISVQNHSYGTGIENYYGADALAYDATTQSNSALLHVFSAGNSGEQTGTDGKYAGIAAMANLTGSFKMSKNSISVAATDSFGIVPTASSKGPAYDGRIKPELAAFGQDGSSGAAAMVSGTALLLQQVYKEKHGGALPASALVKAALINSAEDIGVKGPDFQSGYGQLQAYEALQTILNERYFQGSVAQGGSTIYDLTVPANCNQLKLTLCWNDPLALVNAAKSLMNDLDLELINTVTGEIWKPWILNTKPVKDSLLLPAYRGIDTLNTVEQITVDAPMAGNYIVRVHGTAFKAGNTQNFYIAWQQQLTDLFEWHYPLQTDKLTGGKANIIRWSSTYAVNAGTLQFSIDNGSTWQTLVSAVPLADKSFYWIAPDTFCNALLRMTINAQQFLSDTFTISSPLTVQVGFDCADSALLFWNRAAGISRYAVQRLGAKYMESISTVSDTSIILHQPGNAHWYAVTPLLRNPPAPIPSPPAMATYSGISSYTINYTAQGAGCYISNFLADLINDKEAQLLVQLGTTYGIKNVSIEKLEAGVFRSLVTIQPVTNLQQVFTDTHLHSGGNTYRAKIELHSGIILYSDLQTVYYLPDAPFLVFPNPVRMGQPIQLITKEPQTAQVTLFDVQGRMIARQNIFSSPEQIRWVGLSKGIYILIIKRNGKGDFVKKLVVE